MTDNKKKNELAERNARASELKATLENLGPEIIKAVPASAREHLTAERMTRVAMTSLRRSKDLWRCSKMSICAGIILAAQNGLEIDMRGEAWLIPRWNKQLGSYEAEFQIGYQGLLTLMRRASEVELFEARAVFENDVFAYEYGTNPYIKHKPIHGRKEKGEMIGSYAVAVLKSGKSQFEVCEPWFIDKIRARGGNVWDAWPEQMARKTAAIQLCKWLDSSAEIRHLAHLDELSSTGVRQNLVAEYPIERFENETVASSKDENFSVDDLMGESTEQ